MRGSVWIGGRRAPAAGPPGGCAARPAWVSGTRRRLRARLRPAGHVRKIRRAMRRLLIVALLALLGPPSIHAAGDDTLADGAAAPAPGDDADLSSQSRLVAAAGAGD